MILFPAIDLKDGACVRLKLGDMDQATVFNDDGGFVITNEMLGKRYDQVTFPATHNSFLIPCPLSMAADK